MSLIRVVTDSTCDMGEGDAERLRIAVVPLNVHFNGESYRDNVDIHVDEFYRRLREGKETPRTSQPSAGEFEAVYRSLLKEADGIVSVHISSKLSGTCNSALLAAQSFAPEKIAVVDSLTLSYPSGMLAVRVASLAAEGASMAECVSLAQELVPRLKLFVGFDTLEFLRRGGRIGRVQALAAEALSLKPIIHVVDGEFAPVCRVRTRAAAVRRMAELVREFGPLEEVAALYGDDRQPADQLIPLLQDAYPGLPVKVGRPGAVIGTHTGPGAFGAYALLAR